MEVKPRQALTDKDTAASKSLRSLIARQMKVWTSEMEWIAEKAEEVRQRARIQILIRPNAGAEYLIASEMQTGKNKGPALRVKAKYGGVKEKDTRRAFCWFGRNSVLLGSTVCSILLSKCAPDFRNRCQVFVRRTTGPELFFGREMKIINYKKCIFYIKTHGIFYSITV